MKMICCELCGSEAREREVHVAGMDEYHLIFTRQYVKAIEELDRLQCLVRDVNWYSFEAKAGSWRDPWPEGEGYLSLQGRRFTTKCRGGRVRVKSEFPVYYEGPIKDAPYLPPIVVMNELKGASELVNELKEACVAPYEWAPGGRLYEELRRDSTGARAYRALSSDAVGKRDAVSRGKGYGLMLGDGLERAAEAQPETTAQNVLGRVRGDRSLVHPRVDS